MSELSHLSAYDGDQRYWRVVIETPRGSQNKYKYDDHLGSMMLSTVLPQGMSFPYDFGFLPQTRGEDGDPLDVLLLMDEPAFPGCVVPARFIGVIEARQSEKGKKPEKNDRLVAVPVKCRRYDGCKSLKKIDPDHLHEIEEFFVSYNRTRGKRFEVTGVGGPSRAQTLARRGMKKWRQA